MAMVLPPLDLQNSIAIFKKIWYNVKHTSRGETHMPFLPVAPEELTGRPDFIVVTGDAYVDHPSFGAAIITRVLENAGFTVGFLVYQVGTLVTESALGAAFVPGLIAVAVFALIIVCLLLFTIWKKRDKKA